MVKNLVGLSNNSIIKIGNKKKLSINEFYKIFYTD